MQYEQFFTVLAAIVLTAIVGGWLASRTRTIVSGLIACAVLGAAIAVTVLILGQSAQTDGFMGLIVIATFMFSVVISFSSSLVVRRLRRTRGAPSSSDQT